MRVREEGQIPMGDFKTGDQVVSFPVKEKRILLFSKLYLIIKVISKKND